VIPSSAARVAAIAIAIACVAVLAGCGGRTKTQTTTGETTTAATAVVTTKAKAGAPDRAQIRAAAKVPDGDWTEFGYNAQRTDVGPANTGITAKNLGQLGARIVHLPGTVDSSPIQLHALEVDGHKRDVVVVTTTYGRTIALDAQTGAKLWEFTPSAIGSYQGSAQITTAAPIADPDRQYVYTTSPDGLIHKLSLLTGKQVFSGGWPVSVTRDPTHEKLPAALTISGPNLIVTTGGYLGDIPPYQGKVVVINRASGAIVNIFNTLCSNRRVLIVPSTCPASDSAIWGRAGAVIVPGSKDILVTTGNAPFNGSTDWGDSVLELNPTAGRLLHNWTPTNQAQLNADDGDLGSTSPALLGTVDGDNLALQGGKGEVLSLLNLNRLDGTTGPAGPRTGGQIETLPTPGSSEMVTAPAVWREGGKTWVFVTDYTSTAAYVVSAGGGPHLTKVWENQFLPGTSPILAGGLLYVYNPDAGNLVVYRPTTGKILATLPAAPGHWNSPIIIGGRIILPEGSANAHQTTGTMVIYHLPGR
jgi:outer membrane protein assembly factor BamB